MGVANGNLDTDRFPAQIRLNDDVVTREQGNRFYGDIAPQATFDVVPALLGGGRLLQGLAIDVGLARESRDSHHELVLGADPRRRGRVEPERGVGTLVAAEEVIVEPDLRTVARSPEAQIQHPLRPLRGNGEDPAIETNALGVGVSPLPDSRHLDGLRPVVRPPP